jgi:transposase
MEDDDVGIAGGIRCAEQRGDVPESPALRCIAVGRNNWTFAGSDAGGRRAAAIYTLIETAKLNDVDPQAWLTDVLARLQDHPAKRIAELLPWNWKLQHRNKLAA